MERLVILGFRGNVGLRAGLFVALRLKVPAQRSFATRIGARFELVRHVLQHLNVGRNTLGLNRSAGGSEIARRRQPQRAVAGTKRDDGLHRPLAE